jgi:nucleotide-binding universal stress UspA family protein
LHPQDEQKGHAMNLFRRILVPHDFSEHANRALTLAAELARKHGGRLLVLHVITPFNPVSGLPGAAMTLIPDELIAGELRRLKAVVARAIRGRNAPRVECQVVMGDPFQRISDAARGVNSIVMSTAGRTGLSHLLIGSVAEKVVRHVAVPVLTLRPGGVRVKARTRPRAGRRRSELRAARRR